MTRARGVEALLPSSSPSRGVPPNGRSAKYSSARPVGRRHPTRDRRRPSSLRASYFATSRDASGARVFPGALSAFAMSGFSLGDTSVRTTLKYGLNPAAKKKRAAKPLSGPIAAFADADDSDDGDEGAAGIKSRGNAEVLRQRAAARRDRRCVCPVPHATRLPNLPSPTNPNPSRPDVVARLRPPRCTPPRSRRTPRSSNTTRTSNRTTRRVARSSPPRTPSASSASRGTSRRSWRNSGARERKPPMAPPPAERTTEGGPPVRGQGEVRHRVVPRETRGGRQVVGGG